MDGERIQGNNKQPCMGDCQKGYQNLDLSGTACTSGALHSFLSVSCCVTFFPPIPRCCFGSMDEFPSCLRSNLLPPIISTSLEIHLSGPMAAVMWMCGGASLMGQCGLALKGRQCAPNTACQSSPIRVMAFHVRLGHPWRPD